jgi:hypothetical protein
MASLKDLITDKDARFIMFSGTVAPEMAKWLGKNGVPITGKGSAMPPDMAWKTVSRVTDGFTKIREALANQISSRREVVVDPLDPVVAEALKTPEILTAINKAIGKKPGDPLTSSVVLKLGDISGPGSADTLNFLNDLRASRGDADRLRFVPAEDMPEPTPAEALALKAHLDSGPITGKAREGLRKVLALEQVPGDEAKALSDHMETWKTEPLAGVKESVQAQLKANVPREIRLAVESHIKANKSLAGKAKVVLDIGDVKGADDAQTLAVQSWLRGLRSKQGDTAAIFIVVPDTRQYKVVKEYVKRVLGINDSEISSVFADTTKLNAIRPEARVADQMNLSGLKKKTTKVVIGDARTFARGLDLSLKDFTSFEMLILDPQSMDESDVIQAAGRIDPDRTLPGVNRDFSQVMNVQSVRNLPVFLKMVQTEPFFAKLRLDPEFVKFVNEKGDGRSPAIDLSLFQDYISMRLSTGSPGAEALSKEYRVLMETNLKTQQKVIEGDKMRADGTITDPGEPGGEYPGLESAR